MEAIITTLTYPNVLPDFTRSVSLPSFGVTIKSTRNSEVRTLGTELGIGATMALEYKNRSADELNQIISFYKQTRGTWGSFFMSTNIWRQPANYTNALFDLLENAAFRFESKIQITTVKRDVYDFTVQLVTVPATATPPAGTFPSNIVP